MIYLKTFLSKKNLFVLFALLILANPGISKPENKPSKEVPPEKIGEFGHWRAFISRKEGQKTCYMVSFPLQEEGKTKRKGKPHLMITHRPKEKSYNVVSVYSGYRFSKDRKPTLIITGGETKEKFELFVEGESAWAVSDEEDKKITEEVTKKEKVVVKGIDFKGHEIKDTYSLKGSSAAYKEICKMCPRK